MGMRGQGLERQPEDLATEASKPVMDCIWRRTYILQKFDRAIQIADLKCAGKGGRGREE